MQKKKAEQKANVNLLSQEPKILINCNLCASLWQYSVYANELVDFSFWKFCNFISFYLFSTFDMGSPMHIDSSSIIGGGGYSCDLFRYAYVYVRVCVLCVMAVVACLMHMPSLIKVNQHYPRVSIAVYPTNIQNPWNFGWTYFPKCWSSQTAVRNKLNQNKMRSLNIYDRFYLFMWFQIVWMCVIDMLNAFSLSLSRSHLPIGVLLPRNKKKKREKITELKWVCGCERVAS